MDILGKLFGSTALVKVMRMFLFNQEEPFDVVDIAKKASISKESARYEVGLLERIGFLKRRVFYKEIPPTRGRKTPSKRKTQGFIVDQTFPYLRPLYALLVNKDLVSSSEIQRRLKRAGSFKLVLVSGVFIQDPDSRVDMLIVGDRIKKGAIETAIKSIESDIGTELRYAIFDTTQFQYRLSMYDKLLRDILDYPHERIVDRLDV